MTRTFFVTGTDTGVGKTLVTGALLLSARSRGLRALAVKPLAAGCERRDGRLVNADALLLRDLVTPTPAYETVNPVALEAPLAPHIAAAAAGRTLHAKELVAHVAALSRPDLDLLLVEGAGGWLVPLNDAETFADIPRLLGCPVILVVGMRLGCLNHALLTARAIEAAGLALAGWVANAVDPAMAAFDDNVRALEERLPAPRLGTVPWLGAEATPAAVATVLGPSLLW